MPDRLAIRDALPEDATVLTACHNAAVSDGEVMVNGALKQEADLRRWITEHGARESCLVLERDGDVLGWAVVKRYSDRAGYRFCGETFVYVRPDARRRGYGTRLLQMLVERCRTHRYHHLLARLWAENTQSLTFHERHGYEVVGIHREIGLLHGRRLDLVVMQRILDDAGPAGD